MRRNCSLLFIVIFHALSGLTAAAAPDDPFFLQQYDNRNGLSNSSINYIFRDASNILWVATWDGLNMYDGSSFHVFNYSKENDFKSIGSNVIQYITEDKSGNIWITTIEGISRFEKHSGKFYNYFYNQHQRGKVSEQEYALAIDKTGTVYCFNQKSGLSYYDVTTDSFRVCTLSHPFKISKIAFDETSRLWLLNENGELDVWSGNRDRFKREHTYRSDRAIVNFFQVNHHIFFTTADDRLFTIDDITNNQKPVMSMKQGISAMVFYKEHYLLAWSAKGYGVYDNNFQPSSFLQKENQSMQGIRVTSWELGSEDILWYGTDGNGIIKIYPRTKSFGTVPTSDNGLPYNRSVRTFCEENGNLWVGTKGSGIIKISDFWSPVQPSGVNRQYFSAPSELDNNAVYILKKGYNELIYIGTDARGLGIYDVKNKRFNKWAEVKGHNNWPEFGSVYTILQDEDSSLWLGTSGFGLVHLKIDRDKQGGLGIAFLERFTFNNSNTGPANDIIYALANGSSGELWVGCRYGGLSLLDKKTKKFKTFKAFTYEGSLSNNDVLSVYKDSRNRIWIGTSYGLNWIENTGTSGNEPVFQKLTTANGLPNNTIHAIEEDRTGHIWISTNKGLAKVNQADLKVWYYQQSDGLQSNEFCDGAVWKDRLDNLFFGGTYGFNHFLPQDIRKTSWRPNLLLSGILAGTDTSKENGFIILAPDDNKPLDFSIGRKDNFFELNMKAVSFLNTDKCEYAWFLKGYDMSWHTAVTPGKISYSNISPGNYTLYIKWSNGDGIWTNEMELLTLEVKQYFWLTFYAFLVYGLIVSVLAYIIYSYRKNKLEIKHQLAVEHLMRTKEEELHQNRLAFFTNIAHELQTPLTLIMGSAERFFDKTRVKKDDQKDKPYFLSLIHQQASRLTYLVHQLMEFRKVEAGFFKNQYSYLNISEWLNNLAEPFIPLSEQKGIRYELAIDPDLTGWADKDKLEKIIFNLLSNAFKHSEENEHIIFSAGENKSKHELEITIANSGILLSADQLTQLFDKFYVANQNDPGTEKFGTGIGLAFTRQLVTLLNGSIGVSSEDGWLRFKVILPLKPDEAGDNSSRTGSDKPSYLYQAITSVPEPAHLLSVVENNKQELMENLQENTRKKILVVEDEPGIRYLLRDILKEEYSVYEAEDGQKALDLMYRVMPDLVICDVLMPNMNGLELCNKIKNTAATCQVPFILLSAKASEDHHMEGYEVGADAYIAKPFHTSYLKLRIRKLLEYRQKLHDLFKSDSAEDIIRESDMANDDKEFLGKLMHIIEEHLDEPELNAAFVEKAFAMSKMQLYRKLKTMTGMTPGEFIKHSRLKHAAHLLVSTHLTVSEIFYRTGFNNQSYFFREFKKRYNYAPNEYREQQTAF
jgi:signal transduction histidine kinase/DNA-binding response OmpR family regulator/ligand-binding sensor domain-containing protein